MTVTYYLSIEFYIKFTVHCKVYCIECFVGTKITKSKLLKIQSAKFRKYQLIFIKKDLLSLHYQKNK